ncbi:hypothetical protein [Calothrix sp. UHCC 0171]|uniref:hypothetical protein n=1 Tax=Calothrix sp. UHCC 0171 TaxID=3110245 RepID=UPI002B1F2689|nr:hypothetical protein [Calothrix sp. UHCC 0171]MEA5572995.1 hypothetical protein [Calothrix sp. UHCC 0171]
MFHNTSSLAILDLNESFLTDLVSENESMMVSGGSSKSKDKDKKDDKKSKSKSKDKDGDITIINNNYITVIVDAYAFANSGKPALSYH